MKAFLWSMDAFCTKWSWFFAFLSLSLCEFLLNRFSFHIRKETFLRNAVYKPMPPALEVQRLNSVEIPEKTWKITMRVCMRACVRACGHVWRIRAKLLQSCPTLCDPTDCSPPGLLCPGDFPDKNTGVGCHALLQGIFPTQGSNLSLLSLLHWLVGSLPLVWHLGSPSLHGTISRGQPWESISWLQCRKEWRWGKSGHYTSGGCHGESSR